jgi:hypothetical protein
MPTLARSHIFSSIPIRHIFVFWIMLLTCDIFVIGDDCRTTSGIKTYNRYNMYIIRENIDIWCLYKVRIKTLTSFLNAISSSDKIDLAFFLISILLIFVDVYLFSSQRLKLLDMISVLYQTMFYFSKVASHSYFQIFPKKWLWWCCWFWEDICSCSRSSK